MQTQFDKLLDFPCQQTFNCLQNHAPGDYSPSVKPSSKGNYHSLSISVRVTSKEHMETIYTELSKLELVRVVL